MVFNEIENEQEFKHCLSVTSNMDREFIYDCGSTAEDAKHYITRDFKTNISDLTILQRRSKCVGVWLPVDLELDKDKPFPVPNCRATLAFKDVHFYQWLSENKGGLAVGHSIDDKRYYLESLGFCKGTHTLSDEQRNVLRGTFLFFWDYQSRNRGKLEEHLSELAMMTADGDTLSLPNIDLQHYAKIKKLLETAGGVYKRNAFTFKGKDAQAIQRALLQGETLNDKKKYQFFETPAQLVKRAIEALGLMAGERWLEPSAGRGALARAAQAISNHGTVVELMPENVESLKEQGFNPIEGDFIRLSATEIGVFDKILANPPTSPLATYGH